MIAKMAARHVPVEVLGLHVQGKDIRRQGSERDRNVPNRVGRQIVPACVLGAATGNGHLFGILWITRANHSNPLRERYFGHLQTFSRLHEKCDRASSPTPRAGPARLIDPSQIRSNAPATSVGLPCGQLSSRSSDNAAIKSTFSISSTNRRQTGASTAFASSRPPRLDRKWARLVAARNSHAKACWRAAR